MVEFLNGRLLGVRICLLASSLALVVIGICTIYALGHPQGADPDKGLGVLYSKQLEFALLGVGAFVAVNLVNYRRIGPVSYWIYGLVLVCLVYLLLDKVLGRLGLDLPFAVETNGSHRWIRLARGLPDIQPSELAKLGFILVLAWYLRYRSNYRNLRSLLGPFVITLVPMVLILAQPDLGAVLVYMPVLFTMVYVAGAKVKHLLLIVAMAILVSPLLWFRMEPYQRGRISGLLLQSEWFRQKVEASPSLQWVLRGTRSADRRWIEDSVYQVNRSKYAIASGGASGQGFRQGPFIKYSFLTSRHNDFIFAAIAHQWGFLGALGVLLLYALIVLCGLEIAANNTDPFGRLLALGLIAMFTYEALQHVGVTIGIMPVNGLTLPLVSYGGSSLVVNMMVIGLLNNVGRCRPFSLARRL